jgi:hypothetical protein
MVTEEIKQFVISQMKEADWNVEELNHFNEYKSKHINIQHDTTISQKVTFSIKIPSGYSYENLKLSREELGINYFQYRFLLKNVKRSCSLVDKRRREAEISYNWNRFLEKNKDLNRDNKINQIID